jgi:hypothetical protein
MWTLIEKWGLLIIAGSAWLCLAAFIILGAVEDSVKHVITFYYVAKTAYLTNLSKQEVPDEESTGRKKEFN